MSNLQIRLKTCLQTILELEPAIGANEEGHVFFREFHARKAILDRIDVMGLMEDDVARMESATAMFLAELRTVAGKVSDKRLLQ